MDFVASHPLPARLREPLAAVLGGDASTWPDALTAEEVRAIIEHGVAPLVYSVAGMATGAKELRGEAIRAATHEAFRAADLTEVLSALAAAGIEALIMKGTALAYGLYAAPELRPRGDTDLLIAQDDVARIRTVMRALGFDELPSSGDEHGLRQAVYTRAPGMVYDVHWAATNIPAFDAVLRFDELRTRSIPLPALGPHAHALSHVDALLMACIHRVAHHHDSDRLIWLEDIALLRDRMSRPEHERFWRLASQGRVVAVCSRSITVTDAWLLRARHDLAEEWLSPEELTRAEPSSVFLDRDLTRGGVMASSLRALPWRGRIKRLWQLAFPPAEFMRHSFGSRSPLLLPGWYVYRAARGVVRLFRKAASR